MKRDPEFFGDREVVLVYIAKRLPEALSIEERFTTAGIDYCVEADQYHGGFLFRTTRTGAFFYVGVDEETRAVDLLVEGRYKPLPPELRGRH